MKLGKNKFPSNFNIKLQNLLQRSGKGGGVCLIIKEELNSTEENNIIDASQNRFITAKLDNAFPTSCYMSDDSKNETVKDQAYDYINMLLNKFPNNPYTLMGDFNILLQDYGDNPRNDYDNTNRFQEFLIQNDLEIVNNTMSNTCTHKGRGFMYYNDYIVIKNHLNINQFANFQVHYNQLFTDHIPITVNFLFNTVLNQDIITQKIYKINRLQDPIDRQRYQEYFFEANNEFFQIDRDNLEDQYQCIKRNIQDNAEETLSSFIPDTKYNKLTKDLTKKNIEAKSSYQIYKEIHAQFGRINQQVINLHSKASQL